MAGQSDAMVAWKYTHATGAVYRLRAKAAVVAQVDAIPNVKVGGEVAAVTDPLPPRGFRPRKVYVVDANNHKRSVVLYEEGAPLATAGVTILLQYAGAETSFTSTGGMLGQRVPGGITDLT